MNEKLLINRNVKHAVQSASLNAQEKRKPGPSRTGPTSPAWQGKSSANLKRSKKQKEKALATIEKPYTKIVKKSQKKALTGTQRREKFRLSNVKKDEGENETMGNYQD